RVGDHTRRVDAGQEPSEDLAQPSLDVGLPGIDRRHRDLLDPGLLDIYAAEADEQQRHGAVTVGDHAQIDLRHQVIHGPLYLDALWCGSVPGGEERPDRGLQAGTVLDAGDAAALSPPSLGDEDLHEEWACLRSE